MYLTVQEVINTLQHYISFDEEIKEKELLITTNDKSIGSMAYVTIQDIYQGFDWEHGQIRIETNMPIVKKYNSRDIEKPKWIFTEEISNKKYIVCSACESRIGKKDEYCKHCGQKLNNELMDMDYSL